MRLSTALPTLLATTATASGRLGFALGSGRADGSCKSQADLEGDFAALQAQTSTPPIVRTYSAAGCDIARNLLPAARAAGAQVILGIWAESFDADLAAVAAAAPRFREQVYAVTVGSEALYRGSFTGEELLGKIQLVKKRLPGFKVGTADSWNKFQDGTADAIIKGGVDILLCNGFSYWQGQEIGNATGSFLDDMMQAFGRIQSLSGSDDGIELWVGETGWTTAGSKYEAAVPSVDNAKLFYQQGVCGLVNWGYNVFVFEAFDEPGKPPSIGQNGEAADETHWGVMTVDRKPKYDLKC